MLPAFWPAAFFLSAGNVAEILYTQDKGHYFGHGKGDETFQAVPINVLDRAAMKHDYAYFTAGPGRAGRVKKAGADLEMAGEIFTSNPLAAAGLVAFNFAPRVLTFNQFDLPWAD